MDIDLTDPKLLEAIAPLLEKARQDEFDAMCSGAKLVSELGRATIGKWVKYSYLK